MIEVPRGALRAGDLAKHADFFSFGTNDLTQVCACARSWCVCLMGGWRSCLGLAVVQLQSALASSALVCVRRRRAKVPHHA
jgi:citrate lyase beta subunit